jgi:hypothetical protein
METLIFALIGSYNTHRQKEPVVAEAEEFLPFDLQALRNSPDNRPSRWQTPPATRSRNYGEMLAKRSHPFLKSAILKQCNN